MRRLIFLCIWFAFLNVGAQPSSDKNTFVCPPCGMSCDLLEFESPGACHVCQMRLITAGEIEDYNAGVLQPLKEKGVFYLIIFLGIFQGLILIIFLTFSHRARKKKSNLYLALLVLSITLGCAYYLILEYRIIYEHPWMSFLPLKLFYVYGTALYMYVSTYAGRRHSLSKKLGHFLPALMVILLSIVFLALGFDPNSGWYGRYNLFIVDIGGTAHAVIYFILSFRLVSLHNRQIDHYVSNDMLKLKWLKRLMLFVLPFFSLWLLYLIYSIIQPGHLLNNYMFLFWIFAGLLIYWIGYRGLVQPDLFIQSDEILKASQPWANQNLNPYIQALEIAMNEAKLYLNPTLTRQNMADHLKVTPNQLSYILNSLIGKSFYDFVNEHRVAAVIEKMENPNSIHLTLEGMAYESGFNSKSTFNAIFKKLKGMTPKQYRSSITAK